MSSPIGHSVAAIAVYIVTESLLQPSRLIEEVSGSINKKVPIWLIWLIIVASIPDLDYLVKAWRSSNHQGLRITHSIAFSLIAPICTLGFLAFKNTKGRKFWVRSLQVFLASFSHLILDLLVGVTPVALLFPVVNIPIKLSFGILPSAGKIDLSNYYFYRNLKLEMGVLLPILGFAYLWKDWGYFLDKSDRSATLKDSAPPSRTSVIAKRQLYLGKILLSTILILTCAYFVGINLTLPR